MTIRKTVLMCGAVGSLAPDDHDHYCTENKGHRGKHVCGIGTDKGICGHKW